MVSGKKWGITGAILSIGIILIFILIPGDDDRVRAQFDFLAENIAKPPGESQLVGAAKAKRIRTVFTDTVAIHAPAYNYARNLPAAELPALVLSARAPYSDLTLDFYDDTIGFPQENLAEVRITFRLRGRLPSGEYVEDLQELGCRLRLVEGTWRFESIDVVEVLQP